MNYTYDPTKINDLDFNRMRFEIGDTEVDGGKETCALCDEEYTAMIQRATNDEVITWDKAYFYCLKAIFNKFSYDVDYTADDMSLKLSQRWEHWKYLYEKALKENSVLPLSSLANILPQNQLDGGHYFHKDMQRNPPGLYRSKGGGCYDKI